MGIDRNQQARDDFAAARARKQFQDALASGAAAIRDRFGAPLAEGDQVLFHPAFDLVATVTKIVPVFDPRVPVGTMQIVIETAIPTQVMANQPISGVIKMRAAAEPQGASAGAQQAEQEAVPPAVDNAPPPADDTPPAEGTEADPNA